MRTMRILSILMSVAMAVWMANSCQGKDDFSKKDSNSSISITAFCAYGGENGDQTKTTRKENGDLWWSPEDEIMVFCGEASGKFLSQNRECAEIATFVGSFDKEVSSSDVSANGVLAFYPYSDDLIREADAVVFTLPSSQSSVAGTFDDDLYPVIARSDNTDLSFYNICGGAKFTVSQDGIKTVTIRGNDSEPLAGKLSVRFDENGVPTVEVLEGEKEIVVTAPDDGAFEVGKEYYIVTIPQHFKYGFTLIYNDGLNVHNEFKTEKAISIKRSKFGTLRYLDQELDMIAVTEPIVFEDSKVEELCVANWDTNGDGLLSYAEAAAVQTLGNVFQSNTSITSFDELRYFTGLSYISWPAFKYCSSLTSVVIPEGVTSIGDDAFFGCRSLTDVTIPSSVTSIGDNAFYYCSLTSVTIPSSVTSIGDDAFFGCWSLTSVVIHEGVTSIGDGAFCYCSSLTSVTIPSSVTSIGKSAFSYYDYNTPHDLIAPESIYISDLASWVSIDCGDENSIRSGKLYLNNVLLTDVVIPDGVTSIRNYAFSGCSSLTSVVIPEGVTSIGDNAFNYCSALTSVTIPSSVTSIGSSAFYNCSGLTSVYISDIASWCNITCGNSFDNSLNSAKNLYLNGELVTDLVIPEGVTSIGDYAFYNCSTLTSVTIPLSVTTIGSSAFERCSGLTSVYISDIASWCNITCGNSFANPLNSAKNLYLNGELVIDLVIPEGVTSIGDYAFYNCSTLTSVTIPDSVTSIGNDAFRGCSCLSAVYISDMSSWYRISFEDYDSNPVYYAKNLYLNGELVKKIVVPEGSSSIPNYVFSGCSAITSVTIPSSVTRIGNGAFYYCSAITSVTIPSSVTSIGAGAFNGCHNLINVYISSIGSWCRINFETPGSNPLSNAQNLYHNGELVRYLDIPDGVRSIGAYAFYKYSKLTGVAIAKTVTSIGDYAFNGCSKLSQVFCHPVPPPTLSNGAFSNCSLNLQIYVYKSNVEDYRTMWEPYSDFIVGGLAPY